MSSDSSDHESISLGSEDTWSTDEEEVKWVIKHRHGLPYYAHPSSSDSGEDESYSGEDSVEVAGSDSNSDSDTY